MDTVTSTGPQTHQPSFPARTTPPSTEGMDIDTPAQSTGAGNHGVGHQTPNLQAISAPSVVSLQSPIQVLESMKMAHGTSMKRSCLVNCEVQFPNKKTQQYVPV